MGWVIVNYSVGTEKSKDETFTVIELEEKNKKRKNIFSLKRIRGMLGIVPYFGHILFLLSKL